MPELQPIASEALEAGSYDRDRSVLTLRFRGGGTYEYSLVPESLWRALLDAQPHPWHLLADEVRRHPYRRID